LICSRQVNLNLNSTLGFKVTSAQSFNQQTFQGKCLVDEEKASFDEAVELSHSYQKKKKMIVTCHILSLFSCCQAGG
jgi:hypothetical protein